MFDFAGSEILLIGIVALVAIGPKDLPVAIKAVSQMVKKARRMAGEFQTHVDEMVREADLGEARNTFNDLRRMDLKGQLLRAVDGDGTIRKGLSEPAASFTPPPPPVPVHDIVRDIPVQDQLAGTSPEDAKADEAAPLTEVSVPPRPILSEALSSEPAPAFIPPRYAPPSLERTSRRPPSFIPPAFIPSAAASAAAPPIASA